MKGKFIITDIMRTELNHLSESEIVHIMISKQIHNTDHNITYIAKRKNKLVVDATEYMYDTNIDYNNEDQILYLLELRDVYGWTLNIPPNIPASIRLLNKKIVDDVVYDNNIKGYIIPILLTIAYLIVAIYCICN